jgi:hypothetical protein
VLFSFSPVSDIVSTIRPGIRPKPVFFVVLISALVEPAIFPGEDALSVHLVVLPGSGELSPVGPYINTFSINLIVLELAFVVAALFPCEVALPVLLAVLILTCVLRAVRPRLLPPPMLLVTRPLTDILDTGLLVVGAVSVSFVISPIAEIDVSV